MADILIAEQIPDIQDVLLRILGRAGHTIRLTADGDDALQRARNQPPELLIMNPDLPGRDGLDVCRRLRDDPDTATTPILLLSVYQYPAERDAAFDAGANAYLGKPFTPADLIGHVDALLAGSGAITR